ncbi:MAG: hypothetical protein KAI47_27920, partial [Deltaproteobacteria bacterium]|nr:hypothetical protein [Deltaproteobacteria bacterium]
MNDQATQAPEANKLQDALNAVTPRHLTLGLGGLSAIIVVVSTCSALSVDMNALPPPRKAPPSLEASSVFNDRYKKGFYQGQLDDDCKRYKIRRITIDALKGGNPYAVEYTGSQVLRSTKKLETSSLRLTAVTRKLLIGEEGRGIRAKHLALRIE